MYLVGAPHRRKAGGQQLLEKLISERERLVTDAEVLQMGTPVSHAIDSKILFFCCFCA
jgi:hypothetical protein